MSQFKITKGGFQGNVTGSLEGTASKAKAIATSGTTGQVWAMTAAGTQGWAAAGGGSSIIIRTY